MSHHISLNSTQLVRLVLGVDHHVDHGRNLYWKDVVRRVEEDTFFKLILEGYVSSANPSFRWTSFRKKGNVIICTYLWMHDSIISQAMCFSLWLRCWANSGSGQCRSPIKDCRASSFQNRSSDVAQPFLWIQGSENSYMFRDSGFMKSSRLPLSLPSFLFKSFVDGLCNGAFHQVHVAHYLRGKSVS